ncbi:unnamed protein product [Discosporangium mesarthrocarpum]
MDLLREELERKRKKTAELVAKAGGSKGGRKFVRRGEAFKLEKEELESRQAQLQREREEKKRKREEEERKLEDEDEERKRRAGVKVQKSSGEDTIAQVQHKDANNAKTPEDYREEAEIPEKEAKTRLRTLGLPVTLFGETKAERVQRLLQAEEDKGQHHDDYTLGEGHNINNEFLGNVRSGIGGSHLDVATGRDEEITQGKAGESDDSDDEEEQDHGSARKAGQDTVGAGGGGATAAGEEGGGGGTGGGNGAGEEGAGERGSSGKGRGTGKGGRAAGEVAEMGPYKLVRTFFRDLLKQWEQDLNARPDHVKRTVQGKLETKTQKQAKDYMRPLFKLCKSKGIDPGILNNLVEIVRFMKAGEFVRANDIYIMTAIGNAPWPIGLTMVGIHERSGRERISSRNVAHIMNNEAQRKYLVSVKRLMTYLQEKRTDVPPSKKVR